MAEQTGDAPHDSPFTIHDSPPRPMEARDILKKIRRIEIRTRRRVDAAFGGQYHAIFKGRGMNFEDVRAYASGDEVRFIDRNVTARTGELHVKRFVEERELNVMLLVDVSASGAFGTSDQTKRELAAEVAAVLAFSAVRNQDKVGLLLFTDDVELFLPPRKGRSHALRIVREVLFFQPKRTGTKLAAALDALAHLVRRRAVAFVLSDFQSPDFSKALAVTARRHDVVAMPVTDPAEETLPDLGRVTLEDPETGEQFEVNTSSASVREQHQAAVVARRTQLQGMLRRSRVDAVPLRTGEDYLPALTGFFRRRERRIAAR